MSTHRSHKSSSIGFQIGSQRPQLTIKHLPHRIPVKVTEHLQDQITYLCRKISDVEWSGVLFYTTEGEFGTPGFTCIGQGLFLMDIGSSAYTEYSPDSDLVQFMMKNPKYLDMNKGHIHSHNSMSVFFSGTDSGEIHDNSAFHNIYLSLIVNNSNDMVAKICFRATQEESTITYQDPSGEKKTRKVEVDNPGVVFEHDCEIQKPSGVGHDDLEARILAVKNKKRQSGKTESWSLWKTNKSKKNSHKNETPQGVWSPEETMSVINGSKVEKRLYEFTVKLLSQDEYSEKTLYEVLKDIMDTYNHARGTVVEKFYDKLRDTAIEHYKDAYPEDSDLERIEERMRDMRNVLANYDKDFSDLVAELKDELTVELVDKGQDWDLQKKSKKQKLNNGPDSTRRESGYPPAGWE